MKVRFYIRADQPGIFVSVHFGPHRVMLGTGVSIPEKQWNATKGRRMARTGCSPRHSPSIERQRGI